MPRAGRPALALTILALFGCSSDRPEVELPSNHGYALDDALRRLHAVGLLASFPAAKTACGNHLPWVNTQSPRAPATLRRGSVVAIRFGVSPIPSPAVPKRHARFTTVPRLVGREFAAAVRQLHGIWPCVHLQAATATRSTRLVVGQRPRPGTRVPAFGVRVGRGYRPTTVDLTVAAE
jgi:hypothetical protein